MEEQTLQIPPTAKTRKIYWPNIIYLVASPLLSITLVP